MNFAHRVGSARIRTMDHAETSGGLHRRIVMLRNVIFAMATTAMVAGAALTPTVASAGWYHRERVDGRSDLRDIRRDRLEIRRDRADLHRDWRDLNRDARYGSRRDVARDIADIRRDRREVMNDRRDIRNDRRDRFFDRHDY